MSYEEVERLSEGRNGLNITTEEKSPFSVLLLGTDSGDLGRTDQGRSDTLILATINPKKETTMFVSIPRDTYTEIIGHETKDKINVAGERIQRGLLSIGFDRYSISGSFISKYCY